MLMTTFTHRKKKKQQWWERDLESSELMHPISFQRSCVFSQCPKMPYGLKAKPSHHVWSNTNIFLNNQSLLMTYYTLKNQKHGLVFTGNLLFFICSFFPFSSHIVEWNDCPCRFWQMHRSSEE